MRSQCPQDDHCREARRVVCAFLGLALQERFLGLETEDLTLAVEGVWNNYEPGVGPPPFEESTPHAVSSVFRALVEELHLARSGRFASARFFLFALDYEYEEQDMLFTCDLMWPDDSESHPIRLRVSRAGLAPPEWN